MFDRRRSNSKVQQEIEKELIRQFRAEHPGIDFIENQTLSLNKNPKTLICPDICSEKAHIIGEVYAHLGALRPGQKRKISSYILKMLLLDEDRPEKWKKYLIICEDSVRVYLEGNSFLAQAVRQFHIHVKCYPLSEDSERRLREAAASQNMLLDDEAIQSES